MKLILPLAAMTVPIPLLGPFIRFLGVAEVPGAIGLILPGLLRVRPDLTPPAAAGLMIIMTGATVITLLGGGSASALVPLIVGLLSGSVAYGRWRLVPLSPRSKGANAPRPGQCSTRPPRRDGGAIKWSSVCTSSQGHGTVEVLWF